MPSEAFGNLINFIHNRCTITALYSTIFGASLLEDNKSFACKYDQKVSLFLFPRYSYENRAQNITGSSRLVSFIVNDGRFNSTPVFACVELVGVPDAPTLSLARDGAMDVTVNYTEGQTEPLLLVQDLQISGKTTCVQIKNASRFY